VPSYEFALLGRFAVRVDGQPLPAGAWRHTRAAELVKILALADPHRLHCEQVMDLLWPDLAPDAAAGNLRKAVHFARAALGAAQAITRSGAMLELCPGEPVAVDALAFEAAARAGRVGALDAYQGDLLPEDRYAPWAEEPRDRLRALYLRLLKTAAQWERVLEADPADEVAHRSLMRRAIEAGDRRAAVRQFERLCEHLRADLGVGPDPESVALYERALSMEGPGLPTAAERTRALLARGLVQLNTGELAEAEQTARRARTLAMDNNLGNEIGEASSLLGILASQCGEWRQRFRAEFIAAVRADPDAAAHVFDAHLCLAESCLYGPAGHQGMGSTRANCWPSPNRRAASKDRRWHDSCSEKSSCSLGGSARHTSCLPRQPPCTSGRAPHRDGYWQCTGWPRPLSPAAGPSRLAGCCSAASAWPASAGWSRTRSCGYTERSSPPPRIRTRPCGASSTPTACSTGATCARCVLRDSAWPPRSRTRGLAGSTRPVAGFRPPSELPGCGREVRGMPPHGRHAACCGKPKVIAEEQPHCTTRPLTSSRNLTALSTATGVAPRPSAPRAPRPCRGGASPTVLYNAFVRGY